MTTTTTNSAKCIPSGGKSQEPEIWKWGIDETLWNPDRTRYAGRPPPLPGCEGYQGSSDEVNLDLKERMKRADEWSDKCFAMTEDEKKQESRAVQAFLKTLEPLDYDLLDDLDI